MSYLFNCLTCKKEFNSRVKNRKYCSGRCFGLRNSKYRECVICSNIFHLRRGNQKLKTCSYECRIKNIKLRVGKKAANWRNGISKTYYQRHPELVYEKNQKRRSRLYMTGTRHSYKEWQDLKERYQNKCLCCGASKYKLTQDHIVPLALGGSNDIGNIQPLCLSCNDKKGLKIINYRQI